MVNPILSALTNNSMGTKMGMIKSMMTGNPEKMLQQMLNNNPQFRSFYEENKNKTPSQIASEHGIDLEEVKKWM